MSNNRGGAALVVLILLAGLVLAAVNVLLYTDAVQALNGLPRTGTFEHILRDAIARRPLHLAYFAAVPLAIAVLLAFAAGVRRQEAPRPAEEVEPSPPAEREGETAVLRLLALLQSEGRLVDFLEENLGDYGDAQVGAAVRSIHEGCRKALHERFTIERVYEQDEGSEIEVPEGFDPAAVRVTGGVRGAPPFRGTLQHAGWKVAAVKLPETAAGIDPTILAPAEVEVPEE